MFPYGYISLPPYSLPLEELKPVSSFVELRNQKTGHFTPTIIDKVRFSPIVLVQSITYLPSKYLIFQGILTLNNHNSSNQYH